MTDKWVGAVAEPVGYMIPILFFMILPGLPDLLRWLQVAAVVVFMWFLAA